VTSGTSSGSKHTDHHHFSGLLYLTTYELEFRGGQYFYATIDSWCSGSYNHNR
jgi:hypothetical protein